ncbi:MxcI [Myxococcus stipitatus]|uniref:MxcI n=1 Tax=Myxococcus stipitatus TaxID=83455 RepID=UPI001F1ECABB|nr:MxcI [Myxococcus stipitatus]MCE9669872.1 MxcI [Myxococcus stipitatus]
MRREVKSGKSSFARGLVAVAALALASCGDDEPSDPGEGGNDGARFLVHSAVETNGSRMNYFTLVDSLDEARVLDYSRSLELPGRPRLYAAQGVGFFAIGSGESPTITRYEVRDGALVAGERLSFQDLGVKNLGAQAVLFVSATKAYYKDSAQGQIIVWNPREMVIEKTLPLPKEFTKQGYATGLSQWASREGEAFFSVGWSTSTYDTVLPGTVLVRIDTATDELSWAEDGRCRDLSKTARVGDTLYFFSGVINGLGHAVKKDTNAGQPDCHLRISPGSRTFDSDFVGSVAPALGADKEGFIVSVGEDGTAWLQVADTTITPTAPGTTYSEWYSKGWSWWKVPFATLTGATRVPGEPGAYNSFTITAGSDFFISQSASDYSTSTLMELSSGTPKSGVSFPGFVLDVARIR